MARLLIMLVVLLVIALIVMAFRRIGRGSPDSNVLIGSVPVGDADFDEHYAELVVRAEDRAATLNASRELHESS